MAVPGEPEMSETQKKLDDAYTRMRNMEKRRKRLYAAARRVRLMTMGSLRAIHEMIN